MESNGKPNIKLISGIALKGLVLCICGIMLNMLLSKLCEFTGIPLFLDSVGTIVTTFVGGFLPGLIVGLVTNFIKSAMGSYTSIYYGSLNVLIAVASLWYAGTGYKKRLFALYVLILSFIGGVMGAFITWFIFGFATTGISADLASAIHENIFISSKLASQISADFVIDLADKLITALLAVLIFKLVPNSVCAKLRYEGWQQTPLTPSQKKAVSKTETRQLSLRTKLIALITVAVVLIAMAAITIGFILFRKNAKEVNAELGSHVAALAASIIEPDMVDEYIAGGESVEGYKEIDEELKAMVAASEKVKYLYVYKIEENGCRVVFDADTPEGDIGAEPGELVPFEDAFEERLRALKAGEDIDPLVSNGEYGWLLTIYSPIRDASGKTVCYIGCDISMEELMQDTYAYVIKQLSLFIGIFTVILAFGVWLAEYNIVLPLNSMAHTMSLFAFDSKQARHESIEKIQYLDIHTGDEIENLYFALAVTTEESMHYVAQIKHNMRMIDKLQSGLIMVLADMVESRDKLTGDHIKNTAAYTKIILNKLKEKGYYSEMLTERYISDVIKSAPLHDIGKIRIPDAILNKPGRLDESEFEVMKMHTVAGSEIISNAIKQVSESGYLEEAKVLALCHHEKWDGTGYPRGLKGEQIPLSARIMAVADVFDALVARRAYKEGMPVEKALSIISDGAGKHFDPLVAQVFIEAEEEVRAVAKSHSNGQ